MQLMWNVHMRFQNGRAYFPNQENWSVCVCVCVFCNNITTSVEANNHLTVCRTPNMSAMYSDTSPDLKVVGSKLKDILEVRISSYMIHTTYIMNVLMNVLW